MLFEMISLLKIVNTSIYCFASAVAAAVVIPSLVLVFAVVMTEYRSNCKGERIETTATISLYSTVYNLQFVHNRPTVDSALLHLPCFHFSVSQNEHFNFNTTLCCIAYITKRYWFLCNIFLSISF